MKANKRIWPATIIALLMLSIGVMGQIQEVRINVPGMY